MKRLYILVALLTACLSVSAQSINEQQAREQAVKFLMSDPGRSGTRQAMKQKPQLETAPVATTGLYVFNVEGGGFVVASGDKRALPVLGYSTTGRFDWERMPENMRWWLKEYSRAIAAFGDMQLSAQTRAGETRAAIAPMIKSLWGQNTVYNQLCPTYEGQVAKNKGERCLTGCVATAMAEVMNYYKWPKAATTSIPAYSYFVNNVQDKVEETFSADALEPITFDWNNILDTYLDKPDKDGNRNVRSDVTEAQKKAVAQLMRYCGQSVRMRYSPVVSLALTSPIAEALRNYFGYDKGTIRIGRDRIGIDNWEKLIYGELAAGRPVIYSGDATGGGHTFICDGYDGAGLFHFDWGWDGHYNNYFALSVLNPYMYDEEVTPNSSFSYEHSIVAGIQPPQEGTQPAPTWPVARLYSKPYILKEEGKDAELFFKVLYSDMVPAEATFKVELFVMDEKTGQLSQYSDLGMSFSMKSQLYYTKYIILPSAPNLPEGTTDFYIGMLCTSVEGAQWTNLSGETQVLRATMKGGNVTYEVLPSPAGLSLQSGKITKGSGTKGSDNDLTLTIKNDGAEYSGALWLREFFIGNDDPDKAYKAIIADPANHAGYTLEHTSKAGAFIKANSSENILFSFSPKSEGTYLFVLYEGVLDGNNELLNRPLAYCSKATLPTGISSAETKVAGEDAPYYNLSGQKVIPQRKGIYIHNGKKVILR